MSTINLPKFIALCGNPTCGKSEVQKILRVDFDVRPIDDGFCLRDYAVRHMGAGYDDVETQEGKAGKAFINGEPVLDVRTGEQLTWRQVLGRIGNQLEALFGTHHIPQVAMLRSESMGHGPFSFGSVRKDQAWAYKKKGGLIVGIKAPWAQPSGNDFDRFDEAAVDIWLENNVRDLEALRQVVATMVAYVSIQRSTGAAIRQGTVISSVGVGRSALHPKFDVVV
jgi:hypothetical protein